jgi:putative ABC transport system ATP-binding protein
LVDAFATCRALSKTYDTLSGGIEALRSVDAAFELGEVTAVVGASGSGKSTLLRLLAGLDRPTRGELLLAGRNLAAASPAQLRRHRRYCATYISQRAADNFVPHLTLREHAADTGGLAAELLTSVGLGHRLESTPGRLSGGEQARGAFALGLSRKTALVVLDEPTAELDRESASALLESIRRQAGAGTAFVIATHDPDVTAIADRVLRLDRGRVVSSDERTRHAAPPALSRPPQFEVVLEARAVSKTYRRAGETLHAVERASIDLTRGELGVLVGRSGSGKSTLLTLLAGWQRAESGELLWAGRPTDPSALPWAKLSYVPQRFGLIPELTIRENVELPARLTGRNELAPRLDELLDQLGLTELASRLPAETSIGQQQRTALARALMLQPTVLLADEPTSHQDADWRDAVWRQLLRATAEGTACLVATHEEEASRYATRLWAIAGGNVIRHRSFAPTASTLPSG